ncbi:MAG TPA: tRNA (guanosine(46)-N7)-methyltransferase TrmB [Bacteroidales bacterium]|nr:tRNA (guanosine(46)-N7)-methyltransferase TrmB [Bacteroidales bacterium]HPK29630.1 tRNA (guanosine(46)-N7)-methyltransferase TrmB [Bacteroidales bacterium]
MSKKNKLLKFRENETFKCLIQPRTEEVFRCDHPRKGSWHKAIFGNDNPIVLELGCGKGEYTIELAERYPERNFIGMDIKGARLWKGAKYANEHKLQNVAFLRTRIEFIESLFAAGEVAEIWITFADPQEGKPKKRLTHPLFLTRYRNILTEGGIVHLKTDSRLLYHYTMEVASANSLEVITHCEDIYGSPESVPEEITAIQTFYESHFLMQGIPITYMAFRINNEEELISPEWDQTPYLQPYKTTTIMK